MWYWLSKNKAAKNHVLKTSPMMKFQTLQTWFDLSLLMKSIRKKILDVPRIFKLKAIVQAPTLEHAAAKTAIWGPNLNREGVHQVSMLIRKINFLILLPNIQKLSLQSKISLSRIYHWSIMRQTISQNYNLKVCLSTNRIDFKFQKQK